jgi:hypothetical protein
MGYNCKPEEWYIEVEKYKTIRNKLNRHIQTKEHKEFALHSRNWFLYNAPEETKIKNINDFLVWCGYEKIIRDFTKEEAKEQILHKAKTLNRPLSYKDFKNVDMDSIDSNIITKFWGNLNNAKRELGLEETGTFRGHVYSKEELLELIRKFVDQTGIIPTCKFIEEEGKHYGFPNRKTFSNNFGSIRIAIEEAGFEYPSKIKYKTVGNSSVSIYNDPELLKQIIYDYIEKYNKVPTIRNMNDEQDRELKVYYRKYFGSWNNCLKELDIKLNSVTQYNDDELKDAFINFVNTYDRVPCIQDFNKTGRPSFWVYQQRFGSWAKACIYYGFKPNQREMEYYMDDGEVCASSYEYDISTWLKGRNISYERNVKYRDFIENYKGKMDCDYKFVLDNGEIWYIEMAGFIHTYEFEKLKQRPEQIYYFKIKYKEKLLRRSNSNYLIISVDDMKKKSLSEIFYFLNIQDGERSVG